jgi:hypothetical protein
MRAAFVVAGIFLCLIGAGVVFYQLSESCEDSALAGAYHGYPWCTDVLDHINLTFAGVAALLVGVVVLALGGPLHWVLERSPALEDSTDDRTQTNPSGESD